MQYLAWNDILAGHFFRPENAGRRIFLYATEELITSLNPSGGNGFQDFLQAIQTGPPWPTRDGVCHKAYDTYNEWRTRPLEFPPYIGYLCLFVIAAGHQGDFNPRSYYPRLRELLGEFPSTGAYPFFDRMLELWDDLEQWSAVEKAGELGIFHAHVQGGKIHIGVPLSQTFLTQEELGQLPSIFAKAGLEPSATPSDRELLSAVYLHGRTHLRPATLRLVDPASSTNNDLRAAIADSLRSELTDWDGTTWNPAETIPSRHSALVICLDHLDLVSRTVRFVFRCRSTSDIPDDGLSLEHIGGGESMLYCEPSVSPWSTPLTDAVGTVLNAASVDWNTNVFLVDKLRGWRCQLNPQPVRILISGTSQGLPGFVGVNRLPGYQQAYMVVHESATADIRSWGRDCCKGFRDLQIQSGLPRRWSMFSIESVERHTGAPVDYPMLASPLAPRLTFEGGLRASRGENYFQFSPPMIHVEGLPDVGQVSVDDVQVSSVKNEACLELPSSVLNEGTKAVQLSYDGETIGRRFSIVANYPWRMASPILRFDEIGTPTEETGDGSPWAAGCWVENFDAPDFAFNTLLEVSEHRRVFFVGKIPGQIISWPSEELPNLWSPVWAIPMERRGFTVFCADNIVTAEPKQVTQSDTRDVKQWKEILWHRRKRITPPSNPTIRALWERYQDAAREL